MGGRNGILRVYSLSKPIISNPYCVFVLFNASLELESPDDASATTLCTIIGSNLLYGYGKLKISN